MEIVSWEKIEEERLGPDISRRMFWGRNVMVVKWKLAPETELPVHEHVAEQVTMVERGTVSLIFSDEGAVELGPGDMLVIPANKPHGVKVGPEGCDVTDLFSPIREDFIGKTSTYLPGSAEEEAEDPEGVDENQAYMDLWSFLRTKGLKVDFEQFKGLPLELAARYTYDQECISMGQVRKILGMDKQQAKALIRAWKHGDDHSEYSLRRMHERLVIIPGDPVPPRR
jgi:quercetin dioxygenase-like cupin family protein